MAETTRNKKSISGINVASSVMQIIKLLKIQLLQYMDINEALHSRDQKKKNSLYLLLGIYLFLGVMLASYMGGGAVGLCLLGMERIVPAYVLSITSIVILLFTVLKAGSMLFQTKNYEMLISLPVSPVAIVVSRFLSMYIGNLVLAVLAMLPAGIIYGIYTGAGIIFYILFSASILLVPLVPLTAASVVGAAVTAAAARMKHKNALTIVTSMVLVTGIIAFSFYPAFHTGEITREQITDLTTLAGRQINSMYPLAGLYTDAIVEGSFAAFAAFTVVSIGIFAVFAWVVQWKYASICASLITYNAKNNYVLGKQYRKSPIKAMYGKEIKRYFSSSLYVLNTAVGYVMMLLLALGLFIGGMDKLRTAMEMEAVGEEIIVKMLPFALAVMGMMGTTTLSAVSLEGRQWWIPKSLPVSTKVILDSKILVNLTLAVPSCLIAAVLCAAALGRGGLEAVWLFAVPLMYCVFSAVLGLAINIKFPKFRWNNEAEAVKQGTALFIGMLSEFIGAALGAAFIFLLKGVSYHLLMGVVTIILCVSAAAIYKQMINFDLRKLE